MSIERLQQKTTRYNTTTVKLVPRKGEKTIGHQTPK